MSKDYTKLLLDDDIYLVAKAINKVNVKKTRSRWTNARNKHRQFNNFVIIADENPIARLTIDAFDKYLVGNFNCKALGVSVDFSKENVTKFDFNEEHSLNNHTAILLSVNCDNIETIDEWLVNADKMFKSVCHTDSMCIVSVLVPDFPDLPNGIGSLAEREFDAHIRLIANPSIQQQAFLKVESLCRKATNGYGTKIILLRIPNVFGPGYTLIHNWDLGTLFKESFENKEISISEKDYILKQSLTYTVDAASIVFHMLYNGKPGNIYNFASFTKSLADIKFSIFNKFKEQFALKASCPTECKTYNRCLNDLKLRQSIFKGRFLISNAVCRTFCATVNFPYVDGTNEKIYCGKLDRIKELEMEILKEVGRSNL